MVFVLGLLLILLSYGCASFAPSISSTHGNHEAIQESHGKRPLTVHRLNPRYFTDGSGRAIYLTGSHHWNNLLDYHSETDFDYGAYLEFLRSHNHNFIRLWANETAFSVKDFSLKTRPLLYQRTGSGAALDGKRKFDLRKFDPEYFERLRFRVKQAGDRGIYVMVMLFQGFSVHHKGGGRLNPWPGHPFNAQNNVNGIDGDANGNGEGEEVHTLKIPAVTKLQEDYVRKVLDTLNDLNNVLYEISNESHQASVEWQYHMTQLIHRYEKTKPKQHPVVMTFMWDGNGDNTNRDNPELFAGPADAISPGRGSKAEYENDPPVADGSKVIIIDTDHLGEMNEDWVWKSFLRGLNPVLMDPIGNPKRDPVRKAMGQTLTLSKRVNLANMFPRKDLASSGYCLANPGAEYLVYLPSASQRDGSPPAEEMMTLPSRSVEVDLSEASGTFHVEWLNPVTGEFTRFGSIEGGAARSLTAPFGSPAILYLAVTKANS